MATTKGGAVSFKFPGGGEPGSNNNNNRGGPGGARTISMTGNSRASAVSIDDSQGPGMLSFSRQTRKTSDRDTGPLTSLYMEMDRINSRADFITSLWDEKCSNARDEEVQLQSCRESVGEWFESHEEVGERQLEILTGVRNWMSDASKAVPEIDQTVAELEINMDLQGVVTDINTSSNHAISATSKAVKGLTDILHRLQPMVAMVVRHGKKTKDLAKLATFEATLMQAKMLLGNVQAEKQTAESLLQANAARLSSLETRWAEDRKKNDQKCQNYEHKIKILEMSLANMDARARTLEQEARNFIKMQRKKGGVGGGLGGQVDDTGSLQQYLELQDQHTTLRKEHEEGNAKIASLSQQLKEAHTEIELAKQTIMLQEGSVDRVKKLEADLTDCRKRLVDIRNAAEEERAKLTAEKTLLEEEVRFAKERRRSLAPEPDSFKKELSSTGNEKDQQMLMRLARLESEVEEKEKDYRRRMSDLKRTYDTEADRIKLKFESEVHERDAQLVHTREDYENAMAAQRQQQQEMLRNFQKQLDDQRLLFEQELENKSIRVQEEMEKAAQEARAQGALEDKQRKQSLQRDIDNMKATSAFASEFKLQDLQQKHRSLQAELQSERARFNELSSHNLELQNELDEMHMRADEANAERIKVKQALEEVEAEEERRTQAMEAVRMEGEEALSRLTVNEGGLQDKTEALVVAQGKVVELEDIIVKMTIEREQVEETKTQLDSRLQEVSSQYEVLLQQLDVQGEVRGYIEQISALQKDVALHKEQLQESYERYEKLKSRQEDLVDVIQLQPPPITIVTNYKPVLVEGENEVEEKLQDVLSASETQAAVTMFRRRSVAVAPTGVFGAEAEMDALVSEVVVDALDTAAQQLAPVEGEDAIRQQLADLSEAERAEAVFLYRQRATNLKPGQTLEELAKDIVLETRTKALISRQQKQQRRASRAASVEDEKDSDGGSECSDVDSRASAEDAKWKIRTDADTDRPNVLAVFSRTYPIGTRDRRTLRPTADASVQAEIKENSFHKNIQVDTVPWELVRFPHMQRFDWEQALMENARKQGRVLKDYVKYSVEHMWEMQVKLVRALDGEIGAGDVDHEMRQMEHGLIRLIEVGREKIADLFSSDLGIRNEADYHFFRKLQYGDSLRPKMGENYLDTGTQTFAPVREQAIQVRAATKVGTSQTTEMDQRALLLHLAAAYPDDLLRQQQLMMQQQQLQTMRQMRDGGRPTAMRPHMSVETETDPELELSYARKVVMAELDEERRKREAEEERRRLLVQHEDQNRNKINYGVQLRADNLRSTSWSCAIVSRLLQCLAKERKADPTNEKLLYIKKGLEAKRAHLWEQLRSYSLHEMLLLAEKVRKFVFATKVARRLKAKVYQNDPGKTAYSEREAAATSNEVIVKVLADEVQREQLGPLDPLKLALAQIYVLKVSVEQQGGWRGVLYGPNHVPDLDMNVREWPLKEQLYIFEDIRQLQRKRIEELEKSEHDLEIKLQLEQKNGEFTKMALAKAKDVEKSLKEQVLLEKAKQEKARDFFRSAGDADASVSSHRPRSVRGGDLLNATSGVGLSQHPQDKKEEGGNEQTAAGTLQPVASPPVLERTPTSPKRPGAAGQKSDKPDSTVVIRLPHKSKSPKPHGGEVMFDEQAQHVTVDAWDKDDDRRQPHQPRHQQGTDGGEHASQPSARSRGDKSHTSHSSSTSSSHRSLVHDSSVGDLLVKKPPQLGHYNQPRAGNNEDQSVASSVGDLLEDESTGGWPLDELMREREAVADLHYVLIEALRAVLGLCGLSGTVEGLWPQPETHSPPSAGDLVPHPNRVLTDIALDSGGVRHGVDRHRQYFLDQRNSHAYFPPSHANNSPPRSRSGSPVRGTGGSRMGSRGNNQSREASRQGSPTSHYRQHVSHSSGGGGGVSHHPMTLQHLLRGFFGGRAGPLTLPGETFPLIPASDKVKVLVNRLKNRQSPLTADEVVPVMMADAKRLLTTVQVVSKKLAEQEKMIADSLKSRDSEIRMLVEEHLFLKKELSRLKADYVSEDVSDTIRNLRHHIIITDRELDKANKRVHILQDCVENKGSLVELEELVEKGQELTKQVEQLRNRKAELSCRLSEAREQLLLLGDVDRSDEQKVHMHRTAEGIAQWAETELQQTQYRLELMEREKEECINFSIEVFERIERLAQPIFNSSSFRGFLEWAQSREHNVRVKSAAKAARRGNNNSSTSSSAAAANGAAASLGDTYRGPDGAAGNANANAFLAAQAVRLDTDDIINQLRDLLAVKPEGIDMVMGGDGRSMSSVTTLKSPNSHFAFSFDKRSQTSSGTQVRRYNDAASAQTDNTRPFTTGALPPSMAVLNKRFGEPPEEGSLTSEVSLGGWSSISSMSLPTIVKAEVPQVYKSGPHDLRGLPYVEKTPPLAKRYSMEQSLGLRKKSFTRRR